MQEQQKDSGSFITGFGMGLLTGVAAYFLFATEQGKELRKRALEEWETTQKTITEETGVELPKRLKQLVQEAVGYFAASIKEVQEMQEGHAYPARTGSSQKKKTEAPKKTSGRFKGL
jgi:gas vesicle protein